MVLSGTQRVSVNSARVPAEGESRNASVSADGRYVAFESFANKLVAGDTNFRFVRDHFSTGPVITDQPASCIGDFATFALVASSALGPVTYGWRRDGLPLVNGGAIRGADAATLTIDPVSPADAGSYDCIVSDACQCLASTASAPRTSALPGDFDFSGVVDIADFELMLPCFLGPDVPPAGCSGGIAPAAPFTVTAIWT
jgi:hypothetical protein